MIKLDIVNAVVNKTGVSRTKAEQAVETVFEAMKNALGKGERIELRRFGVFNVRPARPASAAIRAPARKSASLPAKPCASSPARNCKRSESRSHRACACAALTISRI